MKIRTVLTGAAFVVALAGGGVAVAASMANAGTSSTSNTPGHEPGTADTPAIGQVGQIGGKLPDGVTVEKGEAATPAK